MLVGVGMMALLSLAVVVVDGILTLGDNLGLVRDGLGQDNKLVTIKGESQDIVCNFNGAKTPIREIQWEKRGKIERYSETSVYKKNEGNLLIEGHFKIDKIAEDMDGMTVTCSYSMPINSGGINSWNRWEAKVELVVFTLTIQASEKACGDGKGDLTLVLKEARINRKIGEELEERIKSRFEDIFGSNRIYSFNSTYYVTLAFAKVISMKEIFEMESEMFIDGAPASCKMFRPADKIDQREIDVAAAMSAAADLIRTNHSLLIGIFCLLFLIIIIMVWGLNRKEGKTPGTMQYRILPDPEAYDDRVHPKSPYATTGTDTGITPDEGQACLDQGSFLTSQEKGEEEGKHMESSGRPQ